MLTGSERCHRLCATECTVALGTEAIAAGYRFCAVEVTWCRVQGERILGCSLTYWRAIVRTGRCET